MIVKRTHLHLFAYTHTHIFSFPSVTKRPTWFTDAYMHVDTMSAQSGQRVFMVSPEFESKKHMCLTFEYRVSSESSSIGSSLAVHIDTENNPILAQKIWEQTELISGIAQLSVAPRNKTCQIVFVGTLGRPNLPAISIANVNLDPGCKEEGERDFSYKVTQDISGSPIDGAPGNMKANFTDLQWSPVYPIKPAHGPILIPLVERARNMFMGHGSTNYLKQLKAFRGMNI